MRRRWDERRRIWGLLRTLGAAELDLTKVDVLRRVGPDDLSDCERLERLLCEIGLNDEGLHELPPALYPYCGYGLRLWQYPIQFSRYLIHLSRLGISSYLELGVRHGGSFITTVEYLSRFGPLAACVGVDVIACPALTQYGPLNPSVSFLLCNTISDQFEEFVQQHAGFDLTFIDSHHEEDQCRREVHLVASCSRMIALHDIINKDCSGVAAVWAEIKADPAYACVEFTDQYDERGPYMGIGLAVRRSGP